MSNADIAHILKKKNIFNREEDGFRIKERDLNIFYERFVNEKTLEAIGSEVGISKERVRQILKSITYRIGLPKCQKKIMNHVCNFEVIHEEI